MKVETGGSEGASRSRAGEVIVAKGIIWYIHRNTGTFAIGRDVVSSKVANKQTPDTQWKEINDYVS